MLNKSKTWIVGFTIAVGAWSLVQASPYSDYSSSSQVNPNSISGSSVTDDGTTASDAELDANNFAKSFITPGTSTMGAEVSGTGSSASYLQTTTRHDDSWWFNCDAKHICESTPEVGSIPISLTFGINVAETQVTGSAYLEFKASYSLSNSGRFYFDFAQDGSGDFELQSTYTSATGSQSDVPVTTSLRNGIYTLTVDTTLNDSVCNISAPCIPSAMYCANGTCPGTPAFTDTQSISALADGPDEQDIVDGYDPFSVSIVSLDPNFQFVSTDGRTITSNADVPSPVPEPSTLALFGLGVAAIGLARRRRAALPARVI